MKNVIIFFLFLILGCLFVFSVQDFLDLDKSLMDMVYYFNWVVFCSFVKMDVECEVGEFVMCVIYFCLQKKDWVVFGELVKYGEMWCIGVNEVIEIIFFKDVKIGDQLVKAGCYIMYVMVSECEWIVYFSFDFDGWGYYVFKLEDSSVVEIMVLVLVICIIIENLGIVFEEVEEGVYLLIGWENIMVRVFIQF